jgi:uncharacterized protein (DUF1697 family)
MTAYVALFRGVNVGGRNSLPMQDLRDILSSLGCENVRTYIQSGNAAFASAAQAGELGASIEAAIDNRFGFAPEVLLLTVTRLKAIAAANPFPDAESEPKFLHVLFLAEAADEADIDGLNAVRAPSERFLLTDDALYLHAPDGIARSKFAAKVERCLGVAATGRNWNTVKKIIELAGAT